MLKKKSLFLLYYCVKSRIHYKPAVLRKNNKNFRNINFLKKSQKLFFQKIFNFWDKNCFAVKILPKKWYKIYEHIKTLIYKKNRFYIIIKCTLMASLNAFGKKQISLITAPLNKKNETDIKNWKMALYFQTISQ